MILGCVHHLSGQAEMPSEEDEYLIKAVYLYGFGQNVRWPSGVFSDAKTPFVIGILGPDRFGEALVEIARKRTIQERKIVLKHFAAIHEFHEPCHILFVSGELPSEQQREALRRLSRRGLLMVGESPGFAEDGGVVNFFIEGERVRFELNFEAAKRAQLRMDAQLQILSKPVDDRRADGGDSSATPGVGTRTAP